MSAVWQVCVEVCLRNEFMEGVKFKLIIKSDIVFERLGWVSEIIVLYAEVRNDTRKARSQEWGYHFLDMMINATSMAVAARTCVGDSGRSDLISSSWIRIQVWNFNGRESTGSDVSFLDSTRSKVQGREIIRCLIFSTISIM